MRTKISALLVPLALLLLLVSFLELPPNVSGLTLNLGTELIGIVITVAIIEVLIARGKHHEECRRMAWNVLNEVDHCVWVWKGGAREFDIAELCQLLKDVKATDPIAQSTERLLFNIGSRASNTLRTRDGLMKVSPELKQAMAALDRLCGMRNEEGPPAPAILAASLLEAADQLAKVVGLDITHDEPGHSAKPEYRNSSIEHQEWRQYGKPLGAADPATRAS